MYDIEELLDDLIEEDDMPRGRPPLTKTQVTSKSLSDITMMPAANGYVIKSTTTGKDLWVFPDIDAAFEFIRAFLEPTKEQIEFIAKI